jgi:hypothetical protein
MSTNTDTHQLVHLRLPAALLDRLREVAKAEDRSVTAEVKRALTTHVERAEREEQ